ncbi:MAG: chromosome segregation protein SMC [Anaerolineae bacterium]|nr:chromosome segregation protein SMC [Anaerolineae bacterium]
MPRLKQLELQGFKSFADPAIFLYPTGVTAIVGPNGSGKSNIADAIRWVLGEQRLTSIRGRTGEDMIFAGSTSRSRSGMARAAITFDNSERWVPVDFAEVTVERRTYRDGTSDYLLNGNKVRLMDLRDLLDRAGLGRDAYLVIGQGLVDQILSLRPRERLALFEQAAGITPYRTRREDAVGRLDETKGNLQRVYDIVGEIEPRLRRLQRQVEKADEHARLRQELNETLRIWFGYRWGKALSNLEEARQRVVYREDKALALLERSDKLGERVGEQRRLISQHRDELARLHRESSTLHDEAGQRQRELAVARERKRQLQERLEESESNLVPLRSALTSEAEDIDLLQLSLGRADEELQEAEAKLAQAESAQSEVMQQRTAALEQQAEVQARALEARHRLADQQSRLERAGEHSKELEARIVELQAAVASGTERRRAQQHVVELARRDLDEAQAARDGVQAERKEAETAWEAKRRSREQIQEALARRQAELQRITARLEALDRLHAEGAGLYAGVRAVLQAAEQGELHGLPGTISSLIQVPVELERAIEAALGSQLQDVVAGSWQDAEAAIDYLKHNRAGRATFLPLDTLRPPEPLDLPLLPGVIGVASELIQHDATYRPAALLLLGRTAVAQSLYAARQLHHKLQGGFRIVTLEGEIVRSGGSVTGGNSRDSNGPGLLSRERERRELRQQVHEARQQVQATRAELKDADAAIAKWGEKLQNLEQRVRGAAEAVRTRDRELEQATRDLERILQQTQWQETRLRDAQEDRERTQTAQDRLATAEAETQSALAQLTEREQELAAKVNELADADLAKVVAERRTHVAVLAQERESRSVLLSSREREIARLSLQIEDQEQRVHSLQSELSALDGDLAKLTGDYTTARSEADALAARIPPLEERLAELEAELNKLESQDQVTRHTLREAEQRLNQAEVDAGRREDQLQSLRREIEEALDIVISNLPESISTQQPLPLDNIVSPLPTVSAMPQGLESQIRDLRTQIRRLEPVNAAAKDEYVELAERHAFLREQMEDLEKASAHLREIIKELDEMMDTMFSTTFRSIATEFSRVFELLFSGGQARLQLVEEAGERTGVEITARPPGKRTDGLDMLSGGERCLTAVALIFAVMRISPTPFCVLDEVDAMLDEANVGRFRRMLQKLARDTQFVIITHNRGTVEVADTIYGVSMGDDGVSDVLSLDLEDLPASEVI